MHCGRSHNSIKRDVAVNELVAQCLTDSKFKLVVTKSIHVAVSSTSCCSIYLQHICINKLLLPNIIVLLHSFVYLEICVVHCKGYTNVAHILMYCRTWNVQWRRIKDSRWADCTGRKSGSVSQWYLGKCLQHWLGHHWC